MSFICLLRSVGFAGSRRPSSAALLALRSVLSFVPSGCRVSVGCARGVDSAVRSFFAGSPSLLVFSVASGRWGAGRSAFARRSVAVVRSVSPRSGCLVALPSSPSCPAGVFPSRRWYGAGDGTWGAVSFALGCGRHVLLWLPSGCLPPSWSGVEWSVSGSAPVGCWWFGVPVPAAVQLSLF